MHIQQIAEEVVKLIKEGKNKQVKDTFYADNIVSIEGKGILWTRSPFMRLAMGRSFLNNISSSRYKACRFKRTINLSILVQ